MKITKSLIDESAYEGKSKVLWDERIPGFGVRILPSGTKTFVLAYRSSGRQRWLNLGRYGAVTLHQALKVAQDRYLELKAGKDPRTEAERRTMAGKTMADLCDHYMEVHAKAKKESWDRDLTQVNKWIKPKLGKMGVRDVRRAHVSKLHSEIGKTHKVNANRVLSLLSKMFNLAMVWGFLDEDAPNPATKIERFAEVSRDRFLTRDELPVLAAEINKWDDDVLKGLIWLYLLTGIRKRNLMRIKWADVDLDAGVIRLVKHKTSKATGAPHYIPLSAVAVRLLKEMPRFEGNPYVFPGTREGDHRRDLRKAWDTIKKNAGIENLWIHDLRRTVGSYLAQEGRSLALIGKVLGHTSEKTTKIYARFGDQPVREALEEHAKLLENVIDA